MKKPSTLARLRSLYRDRKKLGVALERVSRLQRHLDYTQILHDELIAKTKDLEQRLKRYAAADALTNPLDRTVRLCINLDGKVARQYPELIDDAVRQLAHETRRAISGL